jgi:Fe-S cluster biosynthesis and repair protein YggX
MTTLQDRIAQFRKMAQDDPDNELGHFSLGKLLLEAEQFDEAAKSFERTVALNDQFSKAFQLLGTCYVRLGQRDQALKTLRHGFEVADERGDNIPRDEMGKLISQLGETPPGSKKAVVQQVGVGGFVCHRPGCPAGSHAHQLPTVPMNDELGKQIYEKICADCWKEWLAMGIKVINEMRLDLSDEKAQTVYDNYMKEFLGFA